MNIDDQTAADPSAKRAIDWLAELIAAGGVEASHTEARWRPDRGVPASAPVSELVADQRR